MPETLLPQSQSRHDSSNTKNNHSNNNKRNNINNNSNIGKKHDSKNSIY